MLGRGHGAVDRPDHLPPPMQRHDPVREVAGAEEQVVERPDGSRRFVRFPKDRLGDVPSQEPAGERAPAPDLQIFEPEPHDAIDGLVLDRFQRVVVDRRFARGEGHGAVEQHRRIDEVVASFEMHDDGAVVGLAHVTHRGSGPGGVEPTGRRHGIQRIAGRPAGAPGALFQPCLEKVLRVDARQRRRLA